MCKTLLANSFSLEFMYSPLYFLQALKINHSLHVYTLGNSRSEPEESRMQFRQWVSESGQSRTKVFFQRCWKRLRVLLFKGRPSTALAIRGQIASVSSTHSHSQERHLFDSRECGCQVITRLYSLPAQNSLDNFHSWQVEIFIWSSP